MRIRTRNQVYDYTPQVRAALLGARREAVRLRHPAVATEHILLGLLQERDADELIGPSGVTAGAVRTAAEERLVSGDTESDASRPYTGDAKKALELAMAKAREQGNGTVTLAHLLEGLLNEGRGRGGKVLRELGVALEADAKAAPIRDTHRFEFRIDESSDLSIFEQIVGQVTEAAATGELAPGERLPAVRQLADQLDIAPGTVARAYRELEQRNIVSTDRSSGTRISTTSRSVAVGSRPQRLAATLRPIVVSAFHDGASSAELRNALEEAMRGVFSVGDDDLVE